MPPQRQKSARYQPPTLPPEVSAPGCSAQEAKVASKRADMVRVQSEIQAIIDGKDGQKGLKDMMLDCTRERAEGYTGIVFDACVQYYKLLDSLTLLESEFKTLKREFDEAQTAWDNTYPKCTPPPCAPGKCSQVIDHTRLDLGNCNIPDPDVSGIEAEITTLTAELQKLIADKNKIRLCEVSFGMVMDSFRLYVARKKDIPEIFLGPNGTPTIGAPSTTPQNSPGFTPKNQAIFLLSAFQSAVNSGCMIQVDAAPTMEEISRALNRQGQAGLGQVQTNYANLVKAACAVWGKKGRELTQSANQLDSKIAIIIAKIDKLNKEKTKLTDPEYIGLRKGRLIKKLNEYIQSNLETIENSIVGSVQNASNPGSGEFSTVPASALKGSYTVSSTYGSASINIQKVESLVTKHFGSPANCGPGGPTSDGGPWTYPINVQVQLKVQMNTAYIKTSIDSWTEERAIDNDSAKAAAKAAIDTLKAAQDSQTITISCCKGAE